ncbi:tripartite ATP-independent periplasmic transporter, DctQ component family protein [Hydrogenophaga sp. RAC07]|uniref:TRAP transporter small permease n=1 Tax=Hydrogenophaga sp. RAC07 TaxID=1842537 RepID=UPI00083E1460|nr:TRAP transporter small permease [Hydrogenophaga sp. RAC07]AOF87643.1 tripartite ATP-independent periplasmic transporter, DctQ component family protein [Hydrogenophaga sp. RAC07]
MAETIHRALDAVYLACIWVAGACVFLMSIFIPWGIFARYVLGTGSQWPEPISILLMVIFTFLGAAAAYRAGAHIAVVMLTERMSAGVRGVMAFAVNLLMVGVSAFMVFYGIKLCMGTWGQSIPELPWLPVGLTYVPVPLGGFVTLLFVLEFLVYGDQSQRTVVQFDLISDSEEKAA